MKDFIVSCRLSNKYEPCTWMGPKKDLLAHCKTDHKYSVSVSAGGLAWKYDKIFTETVNLLWDEDELFWCHHRDDSGIMYWTACQIRPHNSRIDYSYDVECFLSGNPNKRMVLQEVCMSHDTDMELIFKTRRCVALPYEALRLYFSINGNIDILDQIVFTARLRKMKG